MPEIKKLNGKDTLCVSIPEMEQCGLTYNYLKKALSWHRSGKLSCWPHHKEGQSIYLHYNGLTDTYKDLIKLHICHNTNVEQFVKNKIVDECIVITNEIGDFFDTYKNNGSFLDPNKKQQYKKSAALLLFMSISSTKNQKLEAFKITDINEYYNIIVSFIQNNKLPLPCNKGNLISKVKDFEKDGCSCLISKKIGNNNSCKILIPEQKALLEEICSDFRNFDAAQSAMVYNEVALNLGWDTICPETARQFKIKHSWVTTLGSRGRKEWEKTFSIQHKRIGPSTPLLYATLDGWDVELMYQNQTVDSKNHIHTEFANRHCIVIVLDPFNKYPLGYAIGEQESGNLIKMALKNSLDHIRSLTGKYYYPYQIQSDHYALKRLTPYYEAMSYLFTPAAVKNAKAKIIEPYFKYLNKNYCQYLPNWSGFGLTARRENQPNRDWLDKTIIKKQFPTKEENIQEIHTIIAKERKLKQAAWIEAYEMMVKDDLREMSRETYLKTFGVVTGDTNKITGHGINITINGFKLTYDTLDINFRKNAFNDWTLIFDPDDISTVLAVTNDTKTQFLLTSKHHTHMAIADQTPQDVEYKTIVSSKNKALLSEITDKRGDNRNIVQKLIDENPVLAETRSKMMFTDNGQQKDNLKIAEKSVRQLNSASFEYDDEDIYVKMFDAGLCIPNKNVEKEEEY